MRKTILLLIFLIVLTNISAVCDSGQIDINTASASKLEELSGIGEVKAQAIIDSRSFDSVDDLIDVYGIGEKTLEKIKEQNLACVEVEKKVEKSSEKVEEDIGEEKEVVEEIDKEIISESSVNKTEVINLIPKTIKSEDVKELNKDKLAKYGFVFFCVLLGSLFILKK